MPYILVLIILFGGVITFISKKTEVNFLIVLLGILTFTAIEYVCDKIGINHYWVVVPIIVLLLLSIARDIVKARSDK